MCPDFSRTEPRSGKSKCEPTRRACDDRQNSCELGIDECDLKQANQTVKTTAEGNTTGPRIRTDCHQFIESEAIF